MGLEEIVPTIILITVLILVVPEFLRANSKSKQLLLYLFIWFLAVISIIVISYLIAK